MGEIVREKKGFFGKGQTTVPASNNGLNDLVTLSNLINQRTTLDKEIAELIKKMEQDGTLDFARTLLGEVDKSQITYRDGSTR